MATLQEQTVHTGNSIYLMIADEKGKYQVVGRAQGLSADRSFGTEPVYEIGSIMPVEYVYNRYEGSVRIERFFVDKKSLKDLGFAALGEDILKMNKLNIVVVSKKDNSIIRAYLECCLANYSEDFRANAIAGENATFLYRRAADSLG